jgi:hypothetical protein
MGSILPQTPGLVCVRSICDARRPCTQPPTGRSPLGEQTGAEAIRHPGSVAISPPAGSGGDLLSRGVVFGGLAAIAVVLMGAVVAIGLPGDGHHRKDARVGATSTQTTTTARRPPPTVTEPPARTEPQTTPQPPAAPTDTTPTDTTPTDTTATDTTGALPAADECHDGVDNDHDNLVDAAQDDGCLNNDTEAPANDLTASTHKAPPASTECNDGIDDDGDGLIDGEDPSCPGPTEYPSDAPG